MSLDEIMKLEYAVEVIEKELARSQKENERLTAIIKRIDRHAPRADKTCVKPGITLSQAVINMLREERHPLFVDAPPQVQETQNPTE